MHYFGTYHHGLSHHRLNEQQADIHHARRSANEAQREADALAQRLERLHLGTAAVWELLSERLGLTEEDLATKIQEIDLRDGALDGRMRRDVPRACPSCDRPNNGRRPSCLYCGEQLPAPPPL